MSDSFAWETRYRTGDTPWDYGYAAPPLTEWLEIREPPTGRILVPGCGLGYDARALAAAGSGEIVGIDLSPFAIDKARSLTLHSGITFAVQNLFAYHGDGAGRFNWIFEHTCFCAIHPRDRPLYVRSVRRLLGPNGHLLAIFFLRPWDSEEEPQGPPFGVERTELDEMFGPWFTVIEEYVPTRAYPGREGRELVRLLRRSEG